MLALRRMRKAALLRNSYEVPELVNLHRASVYPFLERLLPPPLVNGARWEWSPREAVRHRSPNPRARVRERDANESISMADPKILG